MHKIYGENLAGALPCLPVPEGMVALSLVRYELIYVPQIRLYKPVEFIRSLLDRHNTLRTSFDHIASVAIGQLMLHSVRTGPIDTASISTLMAKFQPRPSGEQ